MSKAHAQHAQPAAIKHLWMLQKHDTDDINDTEEITFTVDSAIAFIHFEVTLCQSQSTINKERKSRSKVHDTGISIYHT